MVVVVVVVVVVDVVVVDAELWIVVQYVVGGCAVDPAGGLLQIVENIYTNQFRLKSKYLYRQI